MRKIIIFSTLTALVGFAALARASDQSPAEMRDGAQVTHAAGEQQGRESRNDGMRERHDAPTVKQHDAREDRDEDEDTDAEHRPR